MDKVIKKIYCKNCKYCYFVPIKCPIDNNVFNIKVCLKSIIPINIYNLRDGYELESCVGTNPDFKCSDYKRKWWMIWVK